MARSNKFLELMDNAEKAIEKVNADQIYTSKQFMRIRDEFYVSQKSLIKNISCWGCLSTADKSLRLQVEVEVREGKKNIKIFS